RPSPLVDDIVPKRSLSVPKNTSRMCDNECLESGECAHSTHAIAGFLCREVQNQGSLDYGNKRFQSGGVVIFVTTEKRENGNMLYQSEFLCQALNLRNDMFLCRIRSLKGTTDNSWGYSMFKFLPLGTRASR
ncbi:MAG: hypothetical protein H7832_02060, partial [Magnetococcus sp. DMHC-6]